MARPDKARNKSIVRPMLWIWSWDPTTNTIIHAKIRTTMVRIAVATVESVFRMPHLARMAVTPAKNAEPIANRSHISVSLLSDHCPLKR